MADLLLALFLIAVGVFLLAYGIGCGLDCWLGELRNFRVAVVGGHKQEMNPYEKTMDIVHYYLVVQMPTRQITVEVTMQEWLKYQDAPYVTILTTVGKWSSKYYFPEVI